MSIAANPTTPADSLTDLTVLWRQIEALIAATDTAPVPPGYNASVGLRQRACSYKKTAANVLGRLQAKPATSHNPDLLKQTLAAFGFYNPEQQASGAGTTYADQRQQLRDRITVRVDLIAALRDYGDSLRHMRRNGLSRFATATALVQSAEATTPIAVQ